MIGFYDYTVILTYISFLISLFGMRMASLGHTRYAVVCLALCGLCDMFDGKIARTKKNRTSDEKLFGIQIDSLCDLVCFGVLPIIILYNSGVNSPIGFIFLGFYGLAAIIRLAYYNVLETNRQQTEDGSNKYFHGLPVTSIAIILPVVCLFFIILSHQTFIILLHLVPLLVGLLFIVDFKLKKPNNALLFCIVIFVAVVLLAMYIIRPMATKLF